MQASLKFIADESVERRLVLAIREKYEVSYIEEILKGAADNLVLQNAEDQKRILITADKDFGELVYKWQMLHAGILLYRLHGLPIHEKILLVLSAIEKYRDELWNAMTVISPQNIRIRK